MLGAQTQGMIGYWLLQAMQNALPERQVAAVINQTLVAADDPAFDDPTKFVGQVYDRGAGAAAGRPSAAGPSSPTAPYWRRVVGSPTPQRVVETRLIRLLLDSGAIVVCAGGGGVPVIRNEDGRLEGVEAVVDKDLTGRGTRRGAGRRRPPGPHRRAAVRRGFGTAEAEPILRPHPAPCGARTSPPARWDRRSTRYAGSSSSPAASPPSGAWRTRGSILRGEAGTIVTPSGRY